MTHPKDALEQLIPDLMRLARILAPDQARAEDLAQEALLKVWTRIAQGGEIADLRPYLMTVLRRERARLPRDHQELDAERLVTPTDPAQSRATLRDVIRAMERLPPAQAQLLHRLAAGASYRDMAQQLDVPIGTVMSRAARARAGLRRQLQLDSPQDLSRLLAEMSDV